MITPSPYLEGKWRQRQYHSHVAARILLMQEIIAELESKYLLTATGSEAE